MYMQKLIIICKSKITVKRTAQFNKLFVDETAR